MIDEFVLPLVITAVLSVSIAQCLYVLVAQHGQWRCTLNNLLHVAMSVAMIVMAWSARTQLPTAGPVVFFGFAAIWFVALAATSTSAVRQRLVNGYHAVMMTAMAWMFAVIHSGGPAGHSGHSHHRDVHASGMHTSPGVDASTMELSPKTDELAWITSINWIATFVFAVAAVYWTYRLFGERRTTLMSHEVLLARRELLCQASMAAGAAIMFGATL
ncbi:MAG: hypothetical protein JWR37_5931 [Mycobacterium sp.]|nr:hypothetical protein [Mycobacterium sp.]